MKYLKLFSLYLHKKVRTFFVINILRIVRISSPNLVLTYDSSNPKDGSGAQIQRILSIYSLANFLKIDYTHSEILDISTHALDPFQTEASRLKYVAQLNYVFQIESTEKNWSCEKTYSILNLRALVFSALTSIYKQTKILVKITEPYAIVDYCPDVYNFLPHIDVNEKLGTNIDGRLIVMHYRHGVGGFKKYHGQSTSRQLDWNYYLNCLRMLPQDVIKTHKIILLTDAPLLPMKFRPPSRQLNNWTGSPNFDGEYIHIEKSEIEEFLLNSGFDIEVHRGANPLEDIQIMVNAKYLVIGKSSFSYIAALLNRTAVIFFPKDFWHTPLRNWILRA